MWGKNRKGYERISWTITPHWGLVRDPFSEVFKEEKGLFIWDEPYDNNGFFVLFYGKNLSEWERKVMK